MDDQSLTAFVKREYVSVRVGEQQAILRHREAHLLASGGELDAGRNHIRGGDPGCNEYPEGTRPLDDTEIKHAKTMLACRIASAA